MGWLLWKCHKQIQYFSTLPLINLGGNRGEGNEWRRLRVLYQIEDFFNTHPCQFGLVSACES